MKQIYQLLFTILLCSFTFNVWSQQERRNLPWDIWMHPNTNNFEEIKAQAADWFRDRDKGKGTGYKQWKRWEENNYARLNESGEIFNNSSALVKSYQKAKAYQALSAPASYSRNAQGDWKPWSAIHYTDEGSWGPGIGRLNTIAFHPTDPNTIYVGAPAGGICKTTDHGVTWDCMAEDLASIGVSGIAIHPTNPNIIYILTGDGDGGSGSRSIGVYKTIDGGTNWNATGLEWDRADDVDAYKIMMRPGNPDQLLVAADNGLWRTTNAGTSWTLAQAGAFFDIEFRPNLTSVAYASSTTGLWKSTNGGSFWTETYTISNANRIQIAVGPDDPNSVYLIAGPVTSSGQFRGVFKSDDNGTTFQRQTFFPNILGGNRTGAGSGDQSIYDLCIAVSPNNDSTVITGGVNLWRSNNEGSNFSLTGHWDQEDIEDNNLSVAYVHADHHYLIYNPLNDRLYNANDGGIYFSDDDGTTWTDITGGLDISMLYHFDGVDRDVNVMIAGMQDNGSSLMEKDTMRNILGADGGDCLMHPTDENIIYASWQSGRLSKSIDKGQNFTFISPTGQQNGPFITRWDMDDSDPETIIVGWTNNDVYITNDGGDSWDFESLGQPNWTSAIVSVHIADNSTTMYAASPNNIFRSTDSGETWTTLFNDPNSNDFTSVTAIPGAPNSCIITRGGFDSNNKVWKYDDANGAQPLILHIAPFDNLADTLPPVPVRTVAIPKNQSNRMYVGTEIGVYYNDNINSRASKWQFFKKNLPNAPVRDIHIYEPEGILRAATFGRGVWQSDLYDDCSYNLSLTQGNDPSNGMPTTQFNEASDVITSTRLIQGSNGDVTYKAGDAVLLKNGFRATTGNKVIIGIKPCGRPL